MVPAGWLGGRRRDAVTGGREGGRGGGRRSPSGPCVCSAIFDRDFRGRLRWPAHVYKLYLQCEPLGGAPTPDGVETEEAGYFPLDALPPLSVKTPPEQLSRALAVAADPAVAAAFD